jgi:hypothetical protein
MKDYAVKKNREQASKFGKEELFSKYKTIYAATSALKSGEIAQGSAFKKVTAEIFFSK